MVFRDFNFYLKYILFLYLTIIIIIDKEEGEDCEEVGVKNEGMKDGV